MNNFDKNMEQIFDVTTKAVTPPVVKKETLPAVKVDEAELEEDLADAYEQTKSNLQDLIDQGKSAMGEILEIAKAGQHPRAFEVYGTLLKNMTEANDRLLKIQKEMREISETKNNTSQTSISNAIFVGSTSELNKLLKGKL